MVRAKKNTKNIKNKKKKGKFGIIIKRIFLIVAVVLLLWPIYFIVLYKYVPVYYTPLMLQRSIENIGVENSPKFTKKWVSFSEISPNLTRAVISSEDNLFQKHNGFCFDMIKKAWADIQSGKRFRGGSTISQQTAKNVFLFPIKSFVRKAYEAYLTILIENIWGKERIMEVYLNVIEMGPGVYGAEAAAQTYFNCHAKNLNQSQCALIAACLPNPIIYKVSKPSNYIKKRQSKIISLMPKMGKIEL
ncbi:MAG: monofunctional biosynthetic peptidoglycan transglycosylase [Bacteroidales bacterium]|nr:monofunctional biosynthetic peptidoglycan transglycosylase [Bacteroidales bacterium]